MRKARLLKSYWILAATALCSLLLSGLAIAAEFSADLVIQPKEEEAMQGKIYVKDGKIRQEIMEEGESQVMIVRPDKKLAWMITPEEKSYMEIPYQTDDKAFEEWNPEKEKNSKLIGEETVSGQACKKYESDDNGEKTTLWISKKLSFPIKVQDSETTMEYRNIKEGGVADSLFEVPAGFEKLAMPQMPGSAEGEEAE